MKDVLKVTFEGATNAVDTFDYALMAVGRRPNGREIKAEAAGVTVSERGFIPVDKQMRTNVPHIFGIGDIVGEPMLAHKATHEGKLAAEVIAGHKVQFDARTIPSVAYTDPELAWMGLTETQAEKLGIAYDKAVFPWAASGRALPILFDTIALAAALDPGVCQTEPLRLQVDAEGYTRLTEGPPNAEVCVDCDEDRFCRWMMPRLLGGAPRDA